MFATYSDICSLSLAAFILTVTTIVRVLAYAHVRPCFINNLGWKLKSNLDNEFFVFVDRGKNQNEGKFKYTRK